MASADDLGSKPQRGLGAQPIMVMGSVAKPLKLKACKLYDAQETAEINLVHFEGFLGIVYYRLPITQKRRLW